MADTTAILLPLALLWGAAVILPGPNFLVIVWYAGAQGRGAALRAAAGVLVGAAFWIAAGLFGLKALFVALPFAGVAIKLAGAAYLIWFGVQLVLRARAARADADGRGAAFRAGLGTTLANPKSAAVAASLLAVALPAGAPAMLGVEAFGLLIAISATWYLSVAFATSHPAVVAGFRTVETALARITGALFVLFGIKLAFER